MGTPGGPGSGRAESACWARLRSKPSRPNFVYNPTHRPYQLSRCLPLYTKSVETILNSFLIQETPTTCSTPALTTTPTASTPHRRPCLKVKGACSSLFRHPRRTHRYLRRRSSSCLSLSLPTPATCSM
ncbi:hypothetical protein BRADI_1g57825v3 [Brachypodium distachyon]|uniref:Uncharacterized protein n=1 Tax=Brachypodium distachyon TaxID=15368 RepID=A0A2K2DS51_BRADI|nr:hypothetical protein BRADI_1g57825v3 [Brachypodium distachyon]